MNEDDTDSAYVALFNALNYKTGNAAYVVE